MHDLLDIYSLKRSVGAFLCLFSVKPINANYLINETSCQKSNERLKHRIIRATDISVFILVIVYIVFFTDI